MTSAPSAVVLAEPSDRRAVAAFLDDVDDQFAPPLSERVGSLDEFAGKLLALGRVGLACDRARIVGLTALYANDAATREAYWVLLAVRAEHRSRGLGGGLTRWTLREAAAAGMRTIRLEVDLSNRDAIDFHRHVGFEFAGPAGPHSRYMTATLEPDGDPA